MKLFYQNTGKLHENIGRLHFFLFHSEETYVREAPWKCLTFPQFPGKRDGGKWETLWASIDPLGMCKSKEMKSLLV